jgi:hypothetical protein
MQDKCKLCENERTVKESHIIPKFVFRWLKKTGGAFIRKADNPNKRQEDGVKQYLLCNECEQLFSKLEDKFARDIFYPYSDKKIASFRYDNDLMKFSISVLYRILLFNINEDNSFNESHSDVLTQAFNEWKGFLNQKKKLNKFDKVHIFFTSKTLNKDILPTKRFLSYYSRGIDGTIVSSDKSCIVYAKMARVILIGEINDFDNSEMKDTLINLSGGVLNTKQMNLSYQIREFLIDRVKRINILYDKVSDRQRNIAVDYSNDYMNRQIDSDVSKIIITENNMIIDDSLNDFE